MTTIEEEKVEKELGEEEILKYLTKLKMVIPYILAIYSLAQIAKKVNVNQ